ncbi:MAG: EAL domain-containing protein [Verrucomicrobiae bacterium]|nr:EAL domain-containing protein [Verrucomicrobiae bacterium]MCB1090653.1 EAL domain-containing protein [Verrucomicrobiae bacterium]
MKALVVEDHQPTALILERLLRHSGYEVVVCHHAEAACERILTEGILSFSLCVIDLGLPEKDGIWLCRWIRSLNDGDSPYLIVGTGSDFKEKLAEAFEAGADDYIEKPYETRILELRFAVASERINAQAEQERLSAALEREQELVSAVFDTAATCIVALGSGGLVAKGNQASSVITGQPEDRLIGRSFRSLFPDGRGRDETIATRLEELMSGTAELAQFETQITAPDGCRRDLAWVCRRSRTMAAPDNSPLIVCVGSDITERRRLESQLAFLAERDPLTHLLNRSQLDPAVQRAIDKTSDGHPACLLCLDLDDFKIVNDTGGHAAGDALLQSTAHLLSRHTRPSDTVIRLGGDEFVIVLTNANADQSQAVAERIRYAIEHQNLSFGGRTFNVTSSIGLLELQSGISLEDALARADAACYASKRNGRNLVTLSTSQEGVERTEDQAWHARLIDAIAHDAIDLWLQPIVSLDTGETVFHEVLLRLPGSLGASVPGQFMPSARRYNLLPELDRCVVRNALDMLQFDPNLRLSINLSGRSASDPRLPEFLMSSVSRAGVDPARVIFEITESELISDLPQAIERLTALRARGFRFALDDFGRGYSSFSYLRELPVEIVKIDGSYTQALADDPASAAFVGAITSLAHAIGLRCVAEHVEDASVIAPLRELGVDLAQGYHLGAPRSYLTQSPGKPSTNRSEDVALAT